MSVKHENMNVMFSESPKKIYDAKCKNRSSLTVNVVSPFLEDIPFDSKDMKPFQKY
jgi:hypothetical protein